jgi:hypothetical protein
MGYVCEHEFEQPDPDNPDYSLVEYDLYAQLGLTIRKNLKDNVYEIVKIKSKEVVFSSPSLEDVVKRANELEGAENTIIKCGRYCPKTGIRCTAIIRCPVCSSDRVEEWKDGLARCKSCGEVFAPML